MLEHGEQEKEHSAAQVRVTAEEFARAVARCQARREEAAQHLEGTVTIGEAVRELGLEATPEEILQEVEASRAQQDRQTRARTKGRLAWAGGGALALLFLSLSMVTMRTVAPRAAPPAAIAPAPPSVLPISAPGRTLVLDKSLTKPRLDTLDSIPADRPVHCDLSVTSDHAALANFSGSDVSWTLIKHEGHLYLRGWIANMSPAALQAGMVEICIVKSQLPAGAAPLAVTLRLDRLQCVPGQSSDDLITVRAVFPDRHFTEPWQGMPRR